MSNRIGRNIGRGPLECCDIGTYDCAVPMVIAGRVQGIDICIAGFVAALNAAGIATVNSCCGHEKMPATIILDDDRWVIITDRYTATSMLDYAAQRGDA